MNNNAITAYAAMLATIEAELAAEAERLGAELIEIDIDEDGGTFGEKYVQLTKINGAVWRLREALEKLK